MSRPEVSVLLISWNTRTETRTCLESLHAEAGGLDYEVVAVDNASHDGSAELLAADPRVTLIRNTRNLGFAGPVNQAYRAAKGELILLLNSDICFHPGSLLTMVTFLREHPDAAGVSPLYLNPDGTFQQHYVQQPSFAACLALWTPLKRLPGFRGALNRFTMRGQDFSKRRELSSASCMLVRTNVLDADRIFDEQFPIYWNDAVLTRDLHAAGRRMWMIPEAVVTHTRGASCRLLGPAMRFRHLLGGLVRYLRLTEPRWRLSVFRFVLVADYLLKTTLGRTTPLGWHDLRAALRGDVGPLPDGDTRDWEIVIGRAAPAGSSDRDDQTVRRLVVAPPGRTRVRGFSVAQIGSSVWTVTLPTALPFGHRIWAVNWLNGRLAVGRLRHWLDRHSGARSVQVDDRNAHLAAWLGEDMARRVPAGANGSEFVDA